MALYTLDDTKLRIEFVPAAGHAVHGGQVAVAALCKKLGLWQLLRAKPAHDPRMDRTRGFAPEIMAAQLVVTLCCGGVSLADAERLQSDQGLKRALGVKRFANYEGQLALGWQTLFVGPFLADQLVTGGHTPVSRQLPDFLAALWRDTPAYFFADSASSEGQHLDLVRAQFPKWSFSYNRWTEPLERAAAALPASAWTAVSPDGHYAYVRHQPEGYAAPQVYAVRRWRGDGELFDHYAFCACEEGTRAPRAVWDRHDLKGERERMFSQLLTDLDLDHPPCLALVANQAFYTLAALAYNVLTALKLSELPAEHHGWRVRTLIRHLLTLPAKLSRHARGVVCGSSRPPATSRGGACGGNGTRSPEQAPRAPRSTRYTARRRGGAVRARTAAVPGRASRRLAVVSHRANGIVRIEVSLVSAIPTANRRLVEGGGHPAN